MTPNRTALTLAVAAAIILALYLASGPSDEPAQQTLAPPSEPIIAAQPKTVTPPQTNVEPLPDNRWALGFARSYSVDIAQRVTVDGPQNTGIASDAEVKATLSVTPTETRKDQIVLQLQLLDPTFGGDVWPTTRHAGLGAELSKPSFALVTQDGALVSVQTDRDTSPEARLLLHSLATDLQIVLKDGNGWHTDEHFTGGVQTVQYERKNNRLAKRRTGYRKLTTPGLTADRITGDMLAEIALGTDLWPETVTITDAENLQSGQGMPAIQSERRVAFKRLSTTQNHTALGAHSKATDRLVTAGDVDGKVLAVSFQARRDHKLVEGADLDGLLDDLAGAQPGQALAQTLRRLEAWLRLHPEDSKGFVETIRAAGDVPQTHRMLAALTSAETAEAQSALIALLQDPRPGWDDQHGAAALMVGWSRPASNKAVEALAQIPPESPAWERAVLGIGVQAHRMRQTDPAAADSMVDVLLEGYQTATDAAAKRHHLIALGNTGDPRVLPIIKTATTADDATRAAAAHALRFVQSDTADTLLAHFAKDPVESVRAKAEHIRAARATH